MRKFYLIVRLEVLDSYWETKYYTENSFLGYSKDPAYPVRKEILEKLRSSSNHRHIVHEEHCQYVYNLVEDN